MDQDHRPFSNPAAGAAPVGRLDDLSPLEALGVELLRFWTADAPRQRDIVRLYHAVFPAAEADAMLAALDAFVGTLVAHARRPVMRHDLACPCLGADESAVGRLLAAAAEGAREDALLFAGVLVRPGMALALVAAAEPAGLALRRFLLRSARAAAPGPLH